MGALEVVATILLVIWLGGLLLNIAGGFIHILLVLSIVMFLARFFKKGMQTQPKY